MSLGLSIPKHGETTVWRTLTLRTDEKLKKIHHLPLCDFYSLYICVEIPHVLHIYVYVYIYLLCTHKNTRSKLIKTYTELNEKVNFERGWSVCLIGTILYKAVPFLMACQERHSKYDETKLSEGTLFKETLPSIFLFPVYNQRSNLMWEKIIKCEHSGRHSKLWSLRSQLMTVDIQDAVMNSPIYREQPPANWLCLIITLTHLESKVKVD